MANTNNGGPNLDYMKITLLASNVALNKNVSQSSIKANGDPSRGVDGNTDGNYFNKSVTHTANESTAWWKVDLGGASIVSKITLWNRTDCCGERLSNFHVDLLSKDGKVLATKNYPGTAPTTTNISLSASGVYAVRVQLNGMGILSLAEVQVWGRTIVEIPKELPDPDATPPDKTKPVKVYILSGQSNMVGMADIEKTDRSGTLNYIVKTDGKFQHLVDDKGNWTVRNDVWYKGIISSLGDKFLTVGHGANSNKIGPELQFGHIMGYFHKEPVIILKVSIGNRALAWDLLSPGSERFTVDGITYAGYGDKDDHWSNDDPYSPVNWYAGKTFDRYVSEAKKVLNNFGTVFPQYKNQGYEIAGFVWWQGQKDTLNNVWADRYEFNMVNFINAFRSAFNAQKAPFVIATVGFGGHNMNARTLKVCNAQLAVSGESGKYPEFTGNVLTVDTRDYWRECSVSPSCDGSHYNNNAETYMLVGDALGRGMVRLLQGQ